MRTTLNIDDDLIEAAKALASARDASLGSVLSELVRRGLEAEVAARTNNGFPVFRVSPGAPPITPERVKRFEDEP